MFSLAAKQGPTSVCSREKIHSTTFTNWLYAAARVHDIRDNLADWPPYPLAFAHLSREPENRLPLRWVAAISTFYLVLLVTYHASNFIAPQPDPAFDIVYLLGIVVFYVIHLGVGFLGFILYLVIERGDSPGAASHPW